MTRTQQLNARYERVKFIQNIHKQAGNVSKVWQAMSVLCGIGIEQLKELKQC